MIDLSVKQLFVFDFDGTLVQSNAIKRAAFYEVTAQCPGAAALLDALLKATPPLDRYGICRALAGRIAGIDPDALAAAYTARCEERIIAAPEVPGAARFLRALRDAGRSCVLNSATPEAQLRALVSNLSIAAYIAAMYGGPAGKAENLRRGMAFAKVGAAQTVMIGDRDEDRRAADTVGCGFIGVESDGNDFTAPLPALISQLDCLIDRL